MAQETGFSHILIGEDEEETVIEAGYVAQKEQQMQESFDDVAQQPSTQELQPKQPSRPQEPSSKKKVYTGEEPMPVAQKIVIIAAVVLIVVAIVYYAFFR